MPRMHPYFSIVMPTRNRAGLLPNAVKSVLQQDFEEFELIISDNFSEDTTPDVVRSFNDSRIRYFRTEKSLPIDQSWEFAISHARGEFISFLSDDDAYLPFRLRKCSEILESKRTKLLVHKFANYYPKGNEKPYFEKHGLMIPWFSGESAEVSAKETLRDVYARLEHYQSHPVAAPIYFADMPHVSDGFYHRSLFTSLLKKIPRLINSRMGDIYLGVNVLSEIDRFVYLDFPLTIFAIYPEQTTSQSNLNGMLGNRSQSDAETQFRRVPLKFWTGTNSLADILLEAAEDNPNIGDNYPLNWETYFAKCKEELKAIEALGVDVSQFRAEIEQQTAFENHTAIQSTTSVMQKVWTKVQDVPAAKLARLRIDSSANARFWRKLSIDPREAHLNSILDCATLLDETFIAKIEQFWKGETLFPPKASKLI